MLTFNQHASVSKVAMLFRAFRECASQRSGSFTVVGGWSLGASLAVECARHFETLWCSQLVGFLIDPRTLPPGISPIRPVELGGGIRIF